MKKRAWQKTIKEACEAAGTYKPFFDRTIESLADILAIRDDTLKEYKLSGGSPTIEYTNKNGSTNIVKNPLLVMWDDFNKSALSYWRDLGLTPAGLKKLNENCFKSKEKNTNDLLGKLQAMKDKKNGIT